MFSEFYYFKEGGIQKLAMQYPLTLHINKCDVPE
jgi:hypothetical protein